MKKILFIFQVGLFCCVTAWSAGLPVISVPAEVQVNQDQVYLGSLCKSTGLTAGQLEKIKSRILCQSPLFGKTKRITNYELIEAIRLSGLDPTRLQLHIPEEIAITRKSQDLSSAQFIQTLEQEFLPTLRWKEVKLEKIDFPETLQLPWGNLSLKFVAAPNTNYAAPFYLGVSISVDGEEVQKLFLRAKLSIRDIVPVTSGPLTPKDELNSENVRWEMRPLTSLLHLPVVNAKQLEGKRVRMSLPAGSIIYQDQLYQVPLIKRGDEVNLVYQDDRIRLTTSALSLGSGVKGEKIRVQNKDSKKEVWAEVVDNRTVRVIN